MDDETKEKIADAISSIANQDSQKAEFVGHLLDGDSNSKIRKEMGISDEVISRLKLEIKQLLEEKGIKPNVGKHQDNPVAG